MSARTVRRRRQRRQSEIINSNSYDSNQKSLTELPADTLVDILLRLPAKSLGRIKCVSKTLLNLVNNIAFSTLHTRAHIAATADQVPKLMCFTREDPSSFKTAKGHLVTLQSLKYKKTTIKKGRYAITVSSSTPSMRFVFRNVFCLGTTDGEYEDCLLVNPPSDRGVLRLPRRGRSPHLYDESQFAMGFDDKTNTYKILCVTHHHHEIYDADFNQLVLTTAYILVLGTESWRKLPSLPPHELRSTYDDPVYANGAAHWWYYESVPRDRTTIISFDFSREEFSYTPTPRTSSNMSSSTKLFTLKGCLAVMETAISEYEDRGMIRKMEIWVMKDFDEKQWVSYYSSNRIKDDFPFHYNGFPREWEHGIFMTDYSCSTRLASVFLMDLRTGSVKCVKQRFSKGILLGMYSYSETLISLRDYGYLEEAHEVAT